MRIDLAEEEGVEVQMAPLIDCVFLLLVFFLVATTLKKIEPQLPVELPAATASISVPVQEDLLVIGVDSVGQVYLDGQPASNALLHDTLRDHAEEDPDQPVRIDADRRAPFEYVVRVVELCTFEGLTNVGFHTEERDQQY